MKLTMISHWMTHCIFVVLSDAVPFATALEFVIKRTEVMRVDPAEPNAMLALAAKESAVRNLIGATHLENKLELSVYNSEDSHVVSGQRQAILELAAVASAAGVKATILKVDQGESLYAIPAKLVSDVFI